MPVVPPCDVPREFPFRTTLLCPFPPVFYASYLALFATYPYCPLPPRARCCIAITPRARTSSVLLAQFRSTGVTPFFMRRVQNESRLIILFRSSRAHRAFSFSGSTPIAPPLSTVPICLLTCAVRHLPVLSQASRDAAFQSGCTPELLLFR